GHVEQPDALRIGGRRVLAHGHDGEVVVVAEREERHLLGAGGDRQPEDAVIELFGAVEVAHFQHRVAERTYRHDLLLPVGARLGYRLSSAATSIAPRQFDYIGAGAGARRWRRAQTGPPRSNPPPSSPLGSAGRVGEGADGAA